MFANIINKIITNYIYLNELINPESDEKANKFIFSMEKEYIKAFYDSNGIEHLLNVMSTSSLDEDMNISDYFI